MVSQEEFDNYQMQSALAQQQSDAQSNSYAPQMQEQMQQAQAILVDQTNPKHVVKDIMLRLRGLEELNDGTFVKIAEPKINKDGFDNIWFMLDSFINQNIILSHLEEKEIGLIMNELQSDLVDDLSLNWKKYGIKKKTDLDTINNSILLNVHLALKRAQGQNEKNWLGKISVENISNVGRVPSPKKEGFLSKLKL